MKLILSFLILAFLLVFISCKSEEKKIEPDQKQGEEYVLPPKVEQKPQTMQKQENINPKVAAEIIAVIKENIAATEAEDKERVLKTIHKDSPQMRSTMSGMDYVFASFDMKFELEKVEVLEVNGDEAKIYYVQTTQAIRGEGFAPTRASGIHQMKKENGKWKIYKTEYLTNEPMM